MIAFAKWLIRFIVWILLYYLIITKIAKIISHPELIAINGFNLFVLSVSIGMSFLSSFWNKIISWKNIKYHGYSVLVLVFLPILFNTIDYGIKLLNWVSNIVDAPDIGLIKFSLYLRIVPQCSCENLNPIGIFYAVATSISLLFFFFTSYKEYYWNPKNSYYGDCWDEGE